MASSQNNSSPSGEKEDIGGSSKKQGTSDAEEEKINERKKSEKYHKVFKKSSPNSKITAYLGKRDFIDHISHTDPVDGVVLLDPEYLKDRKVYAHILAAFRYGREDLDVLGLTFRKDLFLASMQVYPTKPEHQRPLTRLQERLIKKLGENAFPFFFELPPNAPASVTLQPAPGDTGKPCGVDYELKTFVGDSIDEKPHKRNSVRLAIRKLTYAPVEPAPQPNAENTKSFLGSSGHLKLEASLDKEKYYHGESISVNVLVDNNTGRSVKKIKISVLQIADIMLFSKANYKCTVAELETEEGFPIAPSTQGFCKVYSLTPLLANNRDKRGLALDGKLKHEDTNLACSTIMSDQNQKENLGIVVQYKVKVRLILGLIPGELSVELPFTLTHPKPLESPPPSRPTSAVAAGEDQPPLDANLIQLDTKAKRLAAQKAGKRTLLSDAYYHERDDDLIFEEFARLRIKGHEGDDTEA
ncbi:beta-arrestin-1-like isoform X2 [Lineus longissimus]|uniref:beta-arrestin-1-like isoform X2 n=1 Tax=Lineus longissimus TaxID=88925 RepID=UPI00315DC0EB